MDAEIAAGTQTAERITVRLVRVDDPAIDEHLAALVSILSPHFPGQRFDKTYTVYDDARTPADVFREFPVFHAAREGNSREPAAVGGGFVYVPRSMLAGAASEADVAAALAHAVVHIELRHATRIATRLRIGNLASAELAAKAPGSVNLGCSTSRANSRVRPTRSSRTCSQGLASIRRRWFGSRGPSKGEDCSGVRATRLASVAPSRLSAN